MKTVKEVMRKNVPSVSPDDNLKKVAKVMKDNSILGLPVVEKGKVEGIITDGDMLNAFYVNVSVYSYEEKMEGNPDYDFKKRIKEFKELKVRDVMTAHARTISENAGADEAAEMLKRFKIKRLVVVDAKNNPVGMVERLNVVDSILSE